MSPLNAWSRLPWVMRLLIIIMLDTLLKSKRNLDIDSDVHEESLTNTIQDFNYKVMPRGLFDQQEILKISVITSHIRLISQYK